MKFALLYRDLGLLGGPTSVLEPRIGRHTTTVRAKLDYVIPLSAGKHNDCLCRRIKTGKSAASQAWPDAIADVEMLHGRRRQNPIRSLNEITGNQNSGVS